MQSLGLVVLIFAFDVIITPVVPPADLKFAETASMANLYEIMAGNLAIGKAHSPAYKEFARTMVAQHTEIGESYERIAERQPLPVPSQLKGTFKTLYDRLNDKKLTGSAFDNVYRQQMIDTHRQALPLFANEGASGKDPELKAFALRWVCTVAHHLEMAEKLPRP